MSRDYARKSRSNKPSASSKGTQARSPANTKKHQKLIAPARSQHGGLSVKWILSLAAVGGFIGFIIYLDSLPAGAPIQPPPQVQEPVTGSKDNSSVAAPQEGKKPGFRFYDMLPESEVVPPDVEEYSPGPAKKDMNYLVQSGSFRSKEDAERQRANIAFQGLRASVQRIDLDNGTVWYRVNVGPFTSRSQASAAVDKLVSINIQPLVRKIPKEG
jgi:cell division protein FtsN